MLSIISDSWWYLKVVAIKYHRRHESVKILWRHHSWAGPHHWPGLGGLWWFDNQTRLAGSTCRLAGCCTQVRSQGELLLLALGLGYWTPLLRVVAWQSDNTGLRYCYPCWLGLLDLALKDAILISLVILGLGSGGRLSCSCLGKSPCVTVIWSLQKLSGAVCEERNSNRDFEINSIKPLTAPHLVPTLTSQHADTLSSWNLVAARRSCSTYTYRLPWPLGMCNGNGPNLTRPQPLLPTGTGP